MNLRLSLLNDQVRKANMGLKIEAIFFFVQSSFGTGQGYRVMIHDLPRFFFFFCLIHMTYRELQVPVYS